MSPRCYRFICTKLTIMVIKIYPSSDHIYIFKHTYMMVIKKFTGPYLCDKTFHLQKKKQNLLCINTHLTGVELLLLLLMKIYILASLLIRKFYECPSSLLTCKLSCRCTIFMTFSTYFFLFHIHVKKYDI